MAGNKNDRVENRRADLRLASGKKVDAVVVDRHEQPLTLLRQAEVLNVSAGGLSLVSSDAVDTGSHVKISVADASYFPNHATGGCLKLDVLSCSPFEGNKHKIRCKLIDGGIPTNLIYGW